MSFIINSIFKGLLAANLLCTYKSWILLRRWMMWELTNLIYKYKLIKHWFPCKKYCRASHRNSISFLVTNRWQFGPNPLQIPWLFHVIYPCFICLPCRNMTWILEKVKSWNFHGICQENDGICIRFVLIFEKLPSKRHEKIPVTFFTGLLLK